MKFTVGMVSLLGVFLAPALANTWLNDVNSDNAFNEPEFSPNSMGGSEAWRTVWDSNTGYVATKVFSKNTCIIAKMDRRGLFDGEYPASPLGYEDPVPYQPPPTENRFMISRVRLQNLLPYGTRIQALCRGIPSYLAYPATGSNFLLEDVPCFKVMINDRPIYYCG